MSSDFIKKIKYSLLNRWKFTEGRAIVKYSLSNVKNGVFYDSGY
jgi:hypothetical protein